MLRKHPGKLFYGPVPRVPTDLRFRQAEEGSYLIRYQHPLRGFTKGATKAVHSLKEHVFSHHLQLMSQVRGDALTPPRKVSFEDSSPRRVLVKLLN